MKNKINDDVMARMLADQQDEITAHHLYNRIAGIVKDEKNSLIIRRIAGDEIKHYNRLRALTKKEIKPQKAKIFMFFWLARILGLTFVIKLLEKGEGKAVKAYSKDSGEFKDMLVIIEDEERHEAELIEMIDE
ncbi:MAG: rubrerythrin family protein, partial [Clostridia bacterium]